MSLISKGLSKVSGVSKLGPKLAVSAGGIGVGIGGAKLMFENLLCDGGLIKDDQSIIN